MPVVQSPEFSNILLWKDAGEEMTVLFETHAVLVEDVVTDDGNLTIQQISHNFTSHLVELKS